MAAVTKSTSMSPDGRSLSSTTPMLGQLFDGKFDNPNKPMAGLQGYGAVQSCENNSSMNGSSPGDTFRLSPTLSIFNYSIPPNNLEDVKPIDIAPQAPDDEPAVDGLDAEMNNMEDTMASKPRTRSCTVSTSKWRQTQRQTQTQKRGAKQKQQPAVSKSRKSPANFKVGKRECKSQPRNRSLERNRIAASKCRQKKKEWSSDLEVNQSKLEKQYKSLHGEYNELLGEVTQLKNFLMIHAGCNDPNIDGWISNEASSYIRRLSQNAGTQGAAAATARANQDAIKETESLLLLDPQVSSAVTSSESNNFSNGYMLECMFATDPTLAQSMTVN